jgi:uncharacterized protein YfdQ (DUF2303 family)
MDTMENITGHDTAAALKAGAALADPKCVIGFAPVVVVPEGMKLEKLERLDDRARPERVKAHPKFDNATSLIAYFNRFKDDDSTLMADLDSSTVRAILDHHQTDGGNVDPVSLGVAARYHDHLATFTAKHSPEWKIWTEKNGKSMGQVEFAEFIENNAPDVAVPSATDLYEMALKFEATKAASFKSAVRLQNGDTAINFQEETAGSVAGGKIEIPKEIKLLIPVYVGDEKGEVVARFRYRLNGGTLALWYDLLRIEHIKRAAFDSMIEKIANDTATVVLSGRPS